MTKGSQARREINMRLIIASFMKTVLTGILFLGLASSANALLIEADYINSGDGLITVDTVTGLEWLDLTETDGMSFNMVEAELLVGGSLFGYRYATLGEVYQLWDNAGINTVGLPNPAGSGTSGPEPSIENYEPILIFQDFVGTTNVSDRLIDSIGLVSDFDPGTPGNHIIAMARRFTSGNFSGTGLITATSGRDPNIAGTNVGSWLVKIDRPEVIGIEIKPGNKRNVINSRAKGGIWVAVLSDTDFPFDPSSQVDISTVEFGPDGAKAISYKVKDINKDGLVDLLLRFKISATGIACGDTEATLTGEIYDGKGFTGTDSIKTVGCKT